MNTQHLSNRLREAGYELALSDDWQKVKVSGSSGQELETVTHQEVYKPMGRGFPPPPYQPMTFLVNDVG